MKDQGQKRKKHRIPLGLTPEQFDEFFLAAIPKPKRGPQGKLSPYKIFNYIMTVLYTGCQWKALPIEKDAHGVQEICPSRVFRTYQNWLKEGVFHKAFGKSVARLFHDGKLDISIIHGDGSTTVAKKGGDQIGYNGHKKTKGEKVVCFTDRNCNVLSPFSTALGNASGMKLLPKALDDLKGFVKSLGMSLK